MVRQYIVTKNGERIVTQKADKIVWFDQGGPPPNQYILDLIALDFTTILELDETTGQFADQGTYNGPFDRSGAPTLSTSGSNSYQCTPGHPTKSEDATITDSPMDVLAQPEFTVLFAFNATSYNTAGWREGVGEANVGVPLWGSEMQRGGGQSTGGAMSLDFGFLRYKVGSNLSNNIIYHAYTEISGFSFATNYIAAIRYDSGVMDFFVDGVKLTPSYGSQSTASFPTTLTPEASIPNGFFDQKDPQEFYLANGDQFGLNGHGIAENEGDLCVGSWACKPALLTDQEIIDLQNQYISQDT